MIDILLCYKPALNIKPVALNLIEEKVGSILEGVSTGYYFLNITLAVLKLKLTINKWDFLKIKSFCIASGTVNNTKWQPTE